MSRHFSEAETKTWLQKQPRKPLSSKIALQDGNGLVLIVKPNYKPGWGLPGGVLEEKESPLQAVLRETEEEVGVRLVADRLRFLGARYGMSPSTGADYVHFLFAAELTAAEIQTIEVDDSEIEDHQWVQPTELLAFVGENVGTLAARLLQAGNPAAYSENDQFFVESVKI